MNKAKAIEMACSLLLDKAFEVSENYRMEKPARGFEREFYDSMAAVEELKRIAVEGGCVI